MADRDAQQQQQHPPWNVSRTHDPLDALCEQHHIQTDHHDGLADWETHTQPAGIVNHAHVRTPANFAWRRASGDGDPSNAVAASTDDKDAQDPTVATASAIHDAPSVPVTDVATSDPNAARHGRANEPNNSNNQDHSDRNWTHAPSAAAAGKRDRRHFAAAATDSDAVLPIQTAARSPNANTPRSAELQSVTTSDQQSPATMFVVRKTARTAQSPSTEQTNASVHAADERSPRASPSVNALRYRTAYGDANAWVDASAHDLARHDAQ